MAMPTSTANWHWKNKNVTRWGKEWFEQELVSASVSGEGQQTARVASVNEVDGDVELGQRKSKLITIYDCRVVISWEGTTTEGAEVKGALTIPEVSHEITVDGLSDYVYEWSLTGDNSAEAQAVLKLAKTKLPAILEAIFKRFPAALIDTHGKDLTVSGQPSRTGTPAAASSTSTPASSTPSGAATPAKKAEVKKAVNTATVTSEASFMASADDLFSLLTDEKRIPMWTHAPAKSEAKEGTEYSLFGGGVRGKFVSLTPSTEFKQTWQLQSPTWPEGHEAVLTTTLNQSTDSTKVTFTLSGVPTGKEEEIKRNIEGYYVQGLKSIGYVQLYPSPPSAIPSTSPSSSRATKEDITPTSSSSSSYTIVIFITVMVLGAAFAIPFLSTSTSSSSSSSSSYSKSH